jgi:hypothetical protein
VPVTWSFSISLATSVSLSINCLFLRLRERKQSVLSLQDEPIPKRENVMKNLTNKFPPLTPAQQAEISALQAMPDESIDYSDIPPLTEEFWQNATRNRFAKKAKKKLLTFVLMQTFCNG